MEVLIVLIQGAAALFSWAVGFGWVKGRIPAVWSFFMGIWCAFWVVTYSYQHRYGWAIFMAFLVIGWVFLVADNVRYVKLRQAAQG